MFFQVSWVSESQNIECYICGSLEEVAFFFPPFSSVSEPSCFIVYCSSQTNVDWCSLEGQGCSMLETLSITSSPLSPLTSGSFPFLNGRWLVVRIARRGKGWHARRCQKLHQGPCNPSEYLQESNSFIWRPALYTASEHEDNSGIDNLAEAKRILTKPGNQAGCTRLTHDTCPYRFNLD